MGKKSSEDKNAKLKEFKIHPKFEYRWHKPRRNEKNNGDIMKGKHEPNK